ncbi:biotin/lipoyl-containing protein [Nannocystis radixulma]|uniref:Biotin/lipoyl-binding protein n=1 Tax=Nannocystis radixulma TaxID=2995305 RepID=A0ABT5AXY2_9BACT|nr:acetyl-CoA carboxylase biotin carboxyl carrier protein subunit [Nannocystis radixulma]MDC0666119.1 biotin/lipoyl-binding protein [Nannocystis radixulma]
MSAREFVVRVGERELVARVTASDPPVVIVDGVTHEVTAVAGGRSHVRVQGEVAQRIVTLDDRGLATTAALGGVAFPLDVRTAQAAARDAALAAGRTGGAGGGLVKAPMPGRVVRVLVSAGQSVERGAPLVIVEAMKMENELLAAVAGTVKAVHVGEGVAVDAGQALVELDPS